MFSKAQGIFVGISSGLFIQLMVNMWKNNEFRRIADFVEDYPGLTITGISGIFGIGFLGFETYKLLE